MRAAGSDFSGLLGTDILRLPKEASFKLVDAATGKAFYKLVNSRPVRVLLAKRFKGKASVFAHRLVRAVPDDVKPIMRGTAFVHDNAVGKATFRNSFRVAVGAGAHAQAGKRAALSRSTSGTGRSRARRRSSS